MPQKGTGCSRNEITTIIKERQNGIQNQIHKKGKKKKNREIGQKLPHPQLKKTLLVYSPDWIYSRNEQELPDHSCQRAGSLPSRMP